MDQRAIEDLIIELLAEEEGTTPTALRQRLEDMGDELPVDSLLAAEIVVRVEDKCGVQIPTSAETTRCLRSVRDFATLIHDLLQEAAGARGTGESA